jgi:hypothetical protein
VRLRARLCFVLLLLAFVMRVCVHRLRAGSLPAFECLSTHLLQIDAPPSSGILLIHRCVRHLRAGFRLFIDVCAAFTWAFASHPRTQYLSIRFPSDYACVCFSLLQDLALALLMLFAYRITKTLRETLVLFTQPCSSPWSSEGFACSETLLFML